MVNMRYDKLWVGDDDMYYAAGTACVACQWKLYTIIIHLYTHSAISSRVMYRGILVSVLKCVVTIYYWSTCSSPLANLHTCNMYTHTLNTGYLNEWVSTTIVRDYKRNFISNYYRYFKTCLICGLTDGKIFKASFSEIMCSVSWWTTWSPQWRPMPFIFSKRQADKWRTVNITNRHRIALRRDAIIAKLQTSYLLRSILRDAHALIGHSACAQRMLGSQQHRGCSVGLSVCLRLIVWRVLTPWKS